MILSTLASAMARLVSIVTALVSIPLTLHYLGSERYGMWLTISSLIAVLSFADLGMGNGLLNRIAAAHGRNDRPSIQRYVSSGFAVLTVISLLIILAFVSFYALIPWPRFFNVQDHLARYEAGPSVAVFTICFALSIPATIVQKIQAGLQESFIASSWQCVGSIVALAGVVTVTKLEMGLPWIVLAFMGGPLVAALSNSLVFYIRSAPDIAPRPKAFSTEAAVQTGQTGLLFLLLQIVVAAAYSSDSLVISHILGPAAVPQYAVPERMFSIVSQLIATVLTPLWPAYGEAISRSDHDWVKQTFFRSLTFSVCLAGAVSGLVALAGPTLLRVWVGSTIQVTPLLLVGFALWKTLEAGGNSVAMFLNGAHVVRFQVITAAVMGVVVLVLKIVLVGSLGVAGSVWATIIGYSICSAIPMMFRVGGILTESSRNL